MSENITSETETEAERETPRGIVYVREADRDDLPAELKAMPGKVYSLHDAAGNRLAIAPSRGEAFALAKRNDLVPHSVH